MTARYLNIVSLNCNGLGDPTKRNNIFNHFVNIGADIILLQETHTDPTRSKRYKTEWKQKSKHHDSLWNSSNEPSNTRSAGVAILLRNCLTTYVTDKKQDDAGRIITIKIIHNNNIYQIQTVYAPNRPDRRGAFFEHVEDLLFPDCPLVQGGDFNMVENPQIDRFGGTPSNTHTKGLTELKQYKQKQQLIDIWREKNKDQRQFTWFAQQQNVNMIASRINRFYVCTSFRKKYIRQEYTVNPWSDHLTVSDSP